MLKKRILLNILKDSLVYFTEFCTLNILSENFNISTNNTVSVEAAKVLWYQLPFPKSTTSWVLT
jgi:hypothetical protein